MPLLCAGLLISLERPPAWVAIALLSFTLACSSVGVSGYWANIIDIGPRFAGPLLGISNTVATLPGVFGNLSTGWILDASGGNWNLVFGLAIALNLLALAVFLRFAQGHVVFN